MFGLPFASHPLAGILKLTPQEVIGQIATRATVVRYTPTTTRTQSEPRLAVLTNQSNVTIIRINKR